MNITWKIGGEAGFGIMSTGLMFSKIAVRHGYNIFDYVEYPSLIRGGHNVYEVRVSDSPVYAQEKKADFLFALNRETVDLHKNELKDGSIVVIDREKFDVNSADFPDGKVILYDLPLGKLTLSVGADKVMENNVALGATMAIFKMDLAVLITIISEIFAKKGEEVINKNSKAAQAGFDYVTSHPPKNFLLTLPKKKASTQMIIAGNEAVGLGAITAGCKFFVAYPMTPSSSLMHFMAAHGQKNGVVVKHAEDEISVINMAIGASYAGVRSMLGTAGGGFSLMVEGLGLAGITETPLVLMVGQRPGPATGMPTWTSQGDLHFVINASQDEFPRIVLAPGDAEEAFFLTVEAFNLADYYQIPVIILTDKYVGESHFSLKVFNLDNLFLNRGKIVSWEDEDKVEGYLRYKITDDGIPVRAFPGMKKAIFTANSYEHDEYGWSSEEAKDRVGQVERRNKKLETYKKTIPDPKIYGEPDADLTLVAWGSTKGPVLQVLKDLREENYSKKVNFLHLTHVWPLPVPYLESILSNAKKKLIIEGNSTSQMASLIRQETGITFDHKLLRFDGRPFYPEDIIIKVKEILS